MVSFWLSTQAARRSRKWPRRSPAPQGTDTADALRERRAGPTHNRQVLDLEAARIARELRAIGPMTRQTLAERCCARHWRQGTFEAAVRHGIAAGRLRELPFGFLAARRGSSAREE